MRNFSSTVLQYPNILLSTSNASSFTNPLTIKYILVLSGYRHTTISLICMSIHKAMATRCLSYHQAASGQSAIRALATAPLRRLAWSVLFTIMTTSHQTTCTVSERSSIKGNTPMQTYRVEFSHYDKPQNPIEVSSVHPLLPHSQGI